MDYLFHGSNTKLDIGKYLEPHISFDYVPYVYATEDANYALLRAGKFNINDIAVKEEHGFPIRLIELRENAFEDLFNTEGYIYMVDKNDFQKKDGYSEYVSSNQVKIKLIMHIDNVLTYMKKYGGFRFVYFKDSDAYFKKNNIDKEAYLERRKARIEKLNNMRQINE